MSDTRSILSRAPIALITTCLGFLAFISIDVLVRLFVVRDRFESVNDVAILMVFELARATAIVVVIAIALRLDNSGRRSAPRLLAITVAMLGIWFAKAFAFGAFPGFVQERLAGWLLGHGAPQRVLAFAFGAPEWAAWIALGAFLRLAVTWPAPLDAGRLRGPTADRAGLMRSVAFAGADVGKAFRQIAARIVSARGFRASRVWPSVIVLGTVHSVLTAGPAKAAFGAIFAFLAALGITNLRAGLDRAPQSVRWRALWMAQGCVTAVVAFVLTGMLSFGNDQGTMMASFAISAVAPFAVLMAVGSGATGRRVPDPRPAIRRTLSSGTAAIIGVFAYLVIQLALESVVVSGLPFRQLIGMTLAASIIALTWPKLRNVADEFMGRAGHA